MSHSVSTEISNNLPSDAKKAAFSKPILLQGAMENELSLLESMLEDSIKEVHHNYPFTKGFIHDLPVIISRTFQGMTNASAATMLAIHLYNPCCIINQGVCGGHDPNIHQGDIILGREIINYSNLKFVPSNNENPLTDSPVIGLEPNNPSVLDSTNEKTEDGKITLFYSSNALMSAVKSAIKNLPDYHFFEGRIGSADCWCDRSDFISHIHERLHTLGEDMESAAVAQLCTNYDIPFLSIRCLSNNLLTQENYNPDTAVRNQEVVLSLLNTLTTDYLCSM